MKSLLCDYTYANFDVSSGFGSIGTLAMVMDSRKAMEKEGWVKRSMNPDDNRVTNVLLTVQGQDFREKTGYRRDAFLAKITIDLPEDEIHVLIATLDKIQARLCHVQFSL